MVEEQKSEIRASQIMEKFKAALSKYVENKEIIKLIVEINLSEGGIRDCRLRTETKI